MVELRTGKPGWIIDKALRPSAPENKSSSTPNRLPLPTAFGDSSALSLPILISTKSIPFLKVVLFDSDEYSFDNVYACLSRSCLCTTSQWRPGRPKFQLSVGYNSPFNCYRLRCSRQSKCMFIFIQSLSDPGGCLCRPLPFSLQLPPISRHLSRLFTRPLHF